ncbi:MAG: isochorismate synthase [Longimicrobiales bacterium]|nr:isochorismate synthase [Longimicrobiales bacterium]
MTNPASPSISRTVAAHPVPFETARRVVPIGDPGAFLRSMEGAPRGFWARGPRWVAHGGILGEVAPGGGVERYRAARDAGRAWRAMGDGQEALRFYGGFSFREDHCPEGRWQAFPATLFHLPAVEFDGEGAGPARLRVRVPHDGDVARARADAEAGADRLVEALSEPGGRLPPLAPGGPAPARVREGDRVRWMEAVEETLAAIRAGGISKAVLARTRDVEVARPIPPVEVLLSLWGQHTRTHAFLFEPRPGAILLGAAPEALATLRDGTVTATAVAGSVRRGGDSREDELLARELLESRKDLAEHRAVVEDMVTRLSALTEPVSAQPEPHILTLARIQHLETEIEAPAPAGMSVLDLVEALHPTPAVCGVPRDAALEFLLGVEPFQRGWYAGPVGWFDGDGEGHFVPALRTTVGDGCHWRLFAGAGIVEGSRPSLEWEETGIKLLPVLRALADSGAALADLDLAPSGEGA